MDYLIGDYLMEIERKPGDIFKSLPKEKQDEIMKELERKLLMEGVETWHKQDGTENDGDSESRSTV